MQPKYFYKKIKEISTIWRAGTKSLASQLFWIVEQDAVVEWALLRWFHQLYSPTQLCGGGTTKSNSNELPISVPLSTVLYVGIAVAALTYPVVGIRDCLSRFGDWFWFDLSSLSPYLSHDLKQSPYPVIIWAKRGIYCAPFFSSFSSPGSCGWSELAHLVLLIMVVASQGFLFLCVDAPTENDQRRFSTCFFSWPFQQSSQRPLWKWPKGGNICNYLSWQRFLYGWKLFFFVSWF